VSENEGLSGKLADPRERLRSFITSTTLNRQNCRASGGRRARPGRNEKSGSRKGKVDGKDSRASPGKGKEVRRK